MPSKARTLRCLLDPSILAHDPLSPPRRARAEAEHPPCRPGQFGFLGRRHQPAPRQGGNNASRGAAFPVRQLLGGLEHVILDIQSRSHKLMLVHHRIKVKRINVKRAITSLHHLPSP